MPPSPVGEDAGAIAVTAVINLTFHLFIHPLVAASVINLTFHPPTCREIGVLWARRVQDVAAVVVDGAERGHKGADRFPHQHTCVASAV